MRIDLSVEMDRAVVPAVDIDTLKEYATLALSCMLQGKTKGVAMHPGVTLEWKLTPSDEVALA